MLASLRLYRTLGSELFAVPVQLITRELSDYPEILWLLRLVLVIIIVFSRCTNVTLRFMLTNVW